MRGLAALFLVGLTGCEGVARMPPSVPDAAVREGPPDFTVRLEVVEPLALPTRQWALPTGFGPGLLATTARGELLLGSPAGLHVALADGGTQRLFDGPLSGLVTLPSGDAMFQTDGGFAVLTAELIRRSELNDALGPTTSMRAVGGELWFTTSTEVLRLEGGVLTRFSRPGVKALRGPVEGRWVALGTEGVSALRLSAGVLESQSLSDEHPCVDALPQPSGAFLCVDDAGSPFRREPSEDGGSRWRPLVLSTEADEGSSRGVQLLGVDVTSGAAWLSQQGTVSRLTGRRLATLALEPFTAVELEDTGSVLFRTATGVMRLGSDAPVGFADQLKPLSLAKCESCHRQSGSAQPVLETSTQWELAIDRVLQRVDPQTPELQRMPRGLEPLTVDELARLRRWKEEGFRP